MELTTTWKEEGIQIGRQEGLQEGRQEGLQEGRQAAALSIARRLLTRRCGTLPHDQDERLAQLAVSQLESLIEAVLDFSSVDDLRQWLDAHPPAAPDAPTPD